MTLHDNADDSLDDLFLGIGGVLLVATFVMATVIIDLAQGLLEAEQAQNFIYLIQNGPRVVRMWYAAAAIYSFSVWFIKLGIAWFLCRLSNNILQYGRWRPLVFGWICFSFCCVIIIYFSVCPMNIFVQETLMSDPGHLSKRTF
jgi:hypothetical protein